MEALKVKISNIKELQELCDTIKAEGCPYKFITIDTVTALEEMAKPLALAIYKKTPAGMGDVMTKDVLTLAHGAGY